MILREYEYRVTSQLNVAVFVIIKLVIDCHDVTENIRGAIIRSMVISHVKLVSDYFKAVDSLFVSYFPLFYGEDFC